MKQVLNLGAGVQSSTVLLMSLHGELPPLDAVIFADTGWEPMAVYEWLLFLKDQMRHAQIPFYEVSIGNIKQDALKSQVRGKVADGRRWASVPYFVLGPNGERGQIRRQCTYEYKIRCIEMCIRRQVLGLKPRQRAPKGVAVRQWFGISWDERTRMRLSEHKWRENWYPLVDRHMTRHNCLEWMRFHSYPEPPRSACIGCPYRHNREWRWLRDNSPKEFQEAITFDEAIRKCGGMRGDVFIHSERIPLKDVDLSTDVDHGQQLLPGFADECAGICGV